VSLPGSKCRPRVTASGKSEHSRQSLGRAILTPNGHWRVSVRRCNFPAMSVDAQKLMAMIDRELAQLSDCRVVAHIQALRVEPTVTMRAGLRSEGEQYPCGPCFVTRLRTRALRTANKASAALALGSGVARRRRRPPVDRDGLLLVHDVLQPSSIVQRQPNYQSGAFSKVTGRRCSRSPMRVNGIQPGQR